MSPEYNTESDNLGIKAWESRTRPSQPFGRWSRWELDSIRERVRGVFDEMLENERFKKRNPALDPSTQFQIDAEKALRRDVAELEAKDPTHAHLHDQAAVSLLTEMTDIPDDLRKAA